MNPNHNEPIAPTAKQRLEVGFEALAFWVTGQPWRLTVGILVLTAIASIGLSKIEVDPAIDGFFRDGDSVFQQYLDFKEEFESDARVIIMIEQEDLFTLPFVNRLRDLQRDLESDLPYLDEVTSMLNTTATQSVDGGLLTQDLFEDWPETPEELEAIRRIAESNPAWKGGLFSVDGRSTTITILADVYLREGERFRDDSFDASGFDGDSFEDATSSTETTKTRLTTTQADEFADAIKEVVSRHEAPDFKMYVAGGPVMDQAHVSIIHSVMTHSSIGILVVIMIVLRLVYRRLSGLLLPLSVILLSSVASYSFLGFTGLKLTLVSQIFPSLLLAFGVLDAVHVLTIFYKRAQSGEEKRSALVGAIGRSGPAILFTSLTTAAGFFTFIGGDLKATADLAIMVPFGVMIALGYTLFFMPALIMLVPIKLKLDVPESSGPSFSERLESRMLTIALYSTAHARQIGLATVILGGLSIWGMTRLEVSFNPVTMLPVDHEVRVHTLYIDEKMGASQALELIVDTGQVNGLYDPSIQNRLDQLNDFAESLEVDGKGIPLSVSIVDVLKQINRSLNDDAPGHYRVPDDRDLIGQELFLFENGGSDVLEDLVDSQFSKTRVSILMPNVNSVAYIPVIKKIRARAEELFAGDADIVVTGGTYISVQMAVNIITSMQQSYRLAAISITLMMIIFLASLGAGALSMIPNFLPIVATLGLMGFVNVPLTIISLLIGAVALGMAVDDTAHFMYNFRKFYELSGDTVDSVRRTISEIGRAIAYTTIIMVLGFSVFLLTPLTEMRIFGLMMALSMVLALLADLVVAPALVRIFYRDKEDKVRAAPTETSTDQQDAHALRTS